MSRFLVLGVALLAGCTASADLTMDAYAPASLYHAEIVECLDQHICQPLCMNVFTLGFDEIESCRIVSHDDVGANVRVHLYGGDDGFGTDIDIIGDDGGCSSDCDDGGIIVEDDPPTDDPPPDDDGSGSGSDDGGGTDDPAP